MKRDTWALASKSFKQCDEVVNPPNTSHSLAFSLSTFSRKGIKPCINASG
jgi:hypothetical protein